MVYEMVKEDWKIIYLIKLYKFLIWKKNYMWNCIGKILMMLKLK